MKNIFKIISSYKMCSPRYVAPYIRIGKEIRCATPTSKMILERNKKKIASHMYRIPDRLITTYLVEVNENKI